LADFEMEAQMSTKSLIRCGKLFDSKAARVLTDQLVAIDGGKLVYVGTPQGGPAWHDAHTIDHTAEFVMPGLIDVHVHLSYGEAKTEEDIDLFASVEFRALRGMEAAQRILRAGYTSICDPTTSGRVSLAIRDAIDCGLFIGPKLTCSGQNISSRQGLVDWYPTWIGVPETSIGRIVRNVDEGIDAIRYQIKDGVDFIKLSMDGDSMNPSSVKLACAFRQSEVDLLVDEAHRLGRKVVVHARGSDGVLTAARAGVDLIFHASWMDTAALDAVLKSGSRLCPTLNLLVNNIEFSQPTDAASAGLVDAHRRELEAACVNLNRARDAGVPFLLGSEAGFAITPYGEWHAKELENHVKYLGFSATEVLQQATLNNAWFTRFADSTGCLEPGRSADILALRKDPTQDIRSVQDKENIAVIYLDGMPVDLTPNSKRQRHPTEFSYAMWNEVYTQERVKTMRLAAE
jgi:imidazolonepropionase-like amidohydrolase